MTDPTPPAELLPCPFCGEQATTHLDTAHSWWEVVCSGATCVASIVGEGSKASAIKAWNRRAAPAEERREPTPDDEDVRLLIAYWRAMAEGYEEQEGSEKVVRFPLLGMVRATVEVIEALTAEPEPDTEAILLRRLAGESEPREPQEDRGCDVCGGRLVQIRGRFPGDADRTVCPTCLADRIDNARSILDPQTYQAMEAR